MDNAAKHLHVVLVVRQIDHAALAEHHIEIDLLAQALPQLHRFFVECGALVPQVVRAHDGGIAAGVAAADPAALNHRHIGDAMLFCQVIGRGQSVAAAADNHDLVALLGFGFAPSRLPAAVAAPSFARKREKGIALSGFFHAIKKRGER